MAVERDDDPRPFVGAVLPARLTRRADGSGRGLVTIDGGLPAQIIPVAAGMTEGTALMVEVVREALHEGAETKPLRVRAAPAGSVPAEGPDLLARIVATGPTVRKLGM